MAIILFALYLCFQLIFYHNNIFDYLFSLYHPYLYVLITILVIVLLDALYEFSITQNRKTGKGFCSIVVFLCVVIFSIVIKKNLFAEYPWLVVALPLSFVNELIDMVLLYPIFFRIIEPLIGNNDNNSQPR